MSQQGIIHAAVLFNCNRKEYLLIDPHTAIGDPSAVTWSWVIDANAATRWVNLLEIEYFLTDTPIGDFTLNPYPWAIQWMYFAS